MPIIAERPSSAIRVRVAKAPCKEARVCDCSPLAEMHAPACELCATLPWQFWPTAFFPIPIDLTLETAMQHLPPPLPRVSLSLIFSL